MKIIDFIINLGAIWILYRIMTSFESGLINGMVHIIVLGISTWLITYICQYYK